MGRHVNNLLLALYKQPGFDLSLLFGKEWLESDKKLPENAPLRELPFQTFHYPERLLERSWKAINYPKIDSLVKKPDWFFAPMETHLPARNVKTAITLHDIQAFEENLPWSQLPIHQKFKKRWELWINRAVKDADLVFTVSAFSKKRLMELLELPEAKVKISGNAVDPVFISLASEVLAKTPDFPYLAIIGGLRPKKGGNELLQLAKKLQKEWPELKLVSWGENDPDLLLQANEFSNIQCMGMISDKEMVAWIKGSHGALFLSWYEGFGLPVLEAMACGVPVICSDQASLPEVAGDAAMLVHPTEVNRQVEYVMGLKDSGTVKHFVEKGHQRYKQFSWDQAAKNVIEAMKEYG